LSSWQTESSTDHSLIEPITTVAESAVLAKVRADAVGKFRVDRHNTSPLRLGVHELEHSIANTADGETLRFTPSTTCHETYHRDQLDVWVSHAPQCIE